MKSDGEKAVPSTEPVRLCACGCGERFEPNRRSQKYKNERHREKAKVQRMTVIKVPAGQADQIRRYLRRFSANPSGVTPLPGAGLWFARQAALWLEKRLIEKQGK